MIHLCVAHMVRERLWPGDLPLYYLGTLAPDAAANREGYTLSDRYRTHFTENGGIAESRQAALRLATEHTREPERSFCLGYAAHLLTDALWDETIFARFLKRHESGGCDTPMRKAYTADMAAIDINLYLTKTFPATIRPLLESAPAMGMDGLVTADEVDKERARTYPWYERKASAPPARPRYIRYGEIEVFLSDAANDLTARLCAAS